MNINNQIEANTNNDPSNLNTIGALLKAARINQNTELNEVAKRLRIRLVYLEAIEQDQFKSLPGDIYAVGFIKSYSKYLSLDSEHIIKQYKLQAGKQKDKTELIFPAFVPENGIPGSSILLLGLMVAIIGYSGWYFFSVRNTFTTNEIAIAPEALTSLDTDKPLITTFPKKEEITPQKNETNISILEKDNIENKKKLDRDNLASKIQMPVLGEPIAKMGETESKDPVTTFKKNPGPEANMLQKPEAKSGLIVSTEPRVKLIPESAVKKDLASNLNVDNKTQKIPGFIIMPNNEPNIKISPKPSQKIQQPPINSSRIIVEALADSYIQIRDNNVNELLVTRLLRQGQRYEVPDRSGLTLITGNAGALRILVDGIAVPAIGPVGAIRRNVILDAIKLKDGFAVME